MRPAEQKERRFRYKQEVWSAFGYTCEYLERMKSQSFRDEEYAKTGEIDSKLREQRHLT